MKITNLDQNQLSESYNKIISEKLDSSKEVQKHIKLNLDNVQKIMNKALDFDEIIKFMSDNEINSNQIVTLLNAFKKIGWNVETTPEEQYKRFLEIIKSDLDAIKQQLEARKIDVEKSLELLNNFNKVLNDDFDFTQTLRMLDETSAFSDDDKLKIIQYFAFISANNQKHLLEDQEEKQQSDEQEGMMFDDLNKTIKEKKKNADYILQKRENINFETFYYYLIHMSEVDLDEKKLDLLKSIKTSATRLKNIFNSIEDIGMRLPRKISANNFKFVQNILKFYDEEIASFSDEFSKFKEIYQKFNIEFGDITKDVSEEKDEILEEKDVEEKDEVFENDISSETKSIDEVVSEPVVVSEEDINSNLEKKAIYDEGVNLLEKYKNSEIPVNMIGLVNALEVQLLEIKEKPTEENIDTLKSILDGFKNLSENFFSNDNLSEKEIKKQVVGPVNILVFLNEGIDKENSVFTDSILEIDSGNRDDVVSKVFQDFNSLLTVKPWTSEISRMGISKLDNLKLRVGKCYGKDKTDKPRNYTCGKNRVCIYAIPVAEENKKKLKEYYELDNLDSILLVGAVTNDHDEIVTLAKSFAKNRDRVLDVNNMFENPDTSVEDLVNLIEDRNPYYEFLENEYKKGESR